MKDKILTKEQSLTSNQTQEEKELLSIIHGVKSSCKCDKCGEEYEVNIFPYINVEQNPEYYAKVKDLSIFKTTCPKCNQSSMNQYDMLFIDPTHKYFLYLLFSVDLEIFQNQVNTFVEEQLKGKVAETNEWEKLHATRVVTDLNELLEKIAIFEVGLDDRVIECLKASLKTTSKFDTSKYDTILFDGMEKENLRFVAFNFKSETIEPLAINVGVGAYNRVLDDTGLHTIKAKDFEKVDEEWFKTNILANEITE